MVIFKFSGFFKLYLKVMHLCFSLFTLSSSGFCYAAAEQTGLHQHHHREGELVDKEPGIS